MCEFHLILVFIFIIFCSFNSIKRTLRKKKKKGNNNKYLHPTTSGIELQ